VGIGGLNIVGMDGESFVACFEDTLLLTTVYFEQSLVLPVRWGNSSGLMTSLRSSGTIVVIFNVCIMPLRVRMNIEKQIARLLQRSYAQRKTQLI
jgi:hypothetical protein